MTELKIKSLMDEAAMIESIVANGIDDEKKRILYAIETAKHNIAGFESVYKMTSQEFIEKFGKNLIEETEPVFEWQAELRLLEQLQKKLNLIDSIEICSK